FTAPVIAAVLPITQSADAGLSTALITITAPAVTDSCDNSVVAVGNRSDALALDAPYPIGVTNIIWTATDASGNVALAVPQTVTVTDSELPVIAGVLPVAVSTDPDTCTATLEITAPTVSDNAGANPAGGMRDDGL